MTEAQHDVAADNAKRAIWQGVQALWQDGCVVELRSLKTKQGTQSGYFDDPLLLAKAAYSLDAQGVPAVYALLNPAAPELLARARNHLLEYARDTTQDVHIVRRTRLLVDLDAKRPSGISATDEQHEAALSRAIAIRDYLRDRGWPDPVYADSGNGAHLIYAIDLPNDRGATKLVQSVLHALAQRFSDALVEVDETVHNAARIVKIPGTMARKGDDVAERPHRRSQVIDVPAGFGHEIVTDEQLQALVAELLPPKAEQRERISTNGSSFDLDAFIARHLILKRGPEAYEGGERWIIECPFDAAHGGTSAAIIRWASGAIVFRCQHNACRSHAWSDVRGRYEPGYRDRLDVPFTIQERVARTPSDSRIGFVRADALKIKPINWFWRDRLPTGEFSLFEGDGGVGKSTVVLDLVARKTCGLPLPGGTPCKAGNVLIVADEDSQTTLVARLQAAGADLSKVLILTHLGPADAPRGFMIPNDANELERFVEEEEIQLVYLDALFNHFAPGLLPKNPQDARIALTPLAKVAHATGIPILATRHWGKTAGDAVGRGLGAGEIKNVARSVIAVARFPESDGTYAVAVAKKNYGKDVPALTYRIDSQQVYDGNGEAMRDAQGELFTVGRIAWGDEAAITADDLAMAGGQDAEQKAGREACAHLIQDFLANGPRPSAQVYDAAKKRGFSPSTTLRAARQIRVEMQTGGFPKTTVWSLTSQSRHDLESDVTDDVTAAASVASQSLQYIDPDVTADSDATGALGVQSRQPPLPRTRLHACARESAASSPFAEIADETGRAQVAL